MKRWHLFVVAALAQASSCASVSGLTLLSPDDPSYCRRCTCTADPPPCPVRDAKLLTTCTLPKVAELMPAGPFRRCGGYVLLERVGGLDEGEMWMFDYRTGRLLGWRKGGGVDATACRDGFATVWRERPGGIVFPPDTSCAPWGPLYGDDPPPSPPSPPARLPSGEPPAR